MPPTRLQSFAHSTGRIFYLDTSAVMPLALAETGGRVPAIEDSRRRQLMPFLERMTKANSRAVCSVLVLEEIAAKVRNQEQRQILDREAQRSWKSYERSNQSQADADLKRVHMAMLKMLTHAADALHKAGVTVEYPVQPASVVLPATLLPTAPVVLLTAAEMGRKVRKAHREFLRCYPKIDSMDALHLAIGLGAAGLRSTVSDFDRLRAG